MRNLLALAALAVLAFLGLGWYLGWYKVLSESAADGHRQIQIDVNTNKIKTDVGKGETEVHNWLTEHKSPNSNPSTSGTPTSFRPSDNTFVFPPTPPQGGGTTLPPPR
jgi:hypothetical protein